MPIPIPNLNQLQINPPQPATMKLQGMQMQNQLSQLGMQKERLGLAKEGQALDREGFEFNKKQAIFAKSRDFISSLEREEFPKYKAWLNDLFPELAALLPDDVKDMPDDEWNELRQKIEVGTDNFSKMQTEQAKQALKEIDESKKRQQKLEDEARRQQERIELKQTPAGKADSDPKTLIAKWLTDHPNATDAEMIAFANSLKGKGLRVTTNPDGTTTIEMGGGSDMTHKTQGAIEEKLLGGQEQYQRMKTISDEFKPEFQEIGFRFQKAWTGIQARLGQDVPEKDKSSLIEFKKYQRKSIDNINLSIKEMTGAQMSEKEADRLRLAQPDPGEKWYQGDDPITFKAKIDDVLKGSRAAIARYTYYKNKGLQDQEIRQLINTNQAVSLESIISGMGE